MENHTRTNIITITPSKLLHKAYISLFHQVQDMIHLRGLQSAKELYDLNSIPCEFDLIILHLMDADISQCERLGMELHEQFPGVMLVLDCDQLACHEINGLLKVPLRSIISMQQMQPGDILNSLRRVRKQGSDFSYLERCLPETIKQLRQYGKELPNFNRLQWKILINLSKMKSKTALAKQLNVHRSTIHNALNDMKAMTNTETDLELLLKSQKMRWIASD